MRISLPRASLARLAGAAVLTAAVLAAGSPASAQDNKKDKDDEGNEISVSLTIENDVKGSLQKINNATKLKKGKWTTKPPSEILRSKDATAAAEADGSGVQGIISYDVEFDDGSPDGRIQISFKNTTKGDPAYTCDATPDLVCDVQPDSEDDEDADQAKLTVNVDEV